MHDDGAPGSFDYTPFIFCFPRLISSGGPALKKATALHIQAMVGVGVSVSNGLFNCYGVVRTGYGIKRARSGRFIMDGRS